MEAADAEVAQLGAPQALSLLLGGAGQRGLGRLDQRADDVRLATLAQQAGQPRVRLGGAIFGDPARDHGLARRGRLGDLRDREVAVDGQRERARDRRRGHVEDVRSAAGRERRALLDAEAVLLVDHGDREVAQLETLLDQRVRPDHDVGAERRLPLALSRRAREQRAADAELEAEVGDREEVLLGERLGRRHQRALAPALDRAQERVERDDRLARADVSLQEPLHRDGSREVAVDLADRLLLVRRERERQHRAVAVDEVSRLAERRSERPLPLGRAPRDAELEDEQLLEREPLPAGLRLAEVARAVHRRERVALQRQPLSLAQLGGERIGDVRRERERCVDDPPHRHGGDLLRRGIDRSEVRRGARPVPDVVGARLEAVAAELAAQPDLRARLEPVDEPRLVEPRDADHGRAVVDASDDPRPPAPAHRPLLDVEHAAADHHLLALGQLGDRELVRGRLVPPRPVLEHVPHRCEPELPELPLRRGGDSRQ